MTLPAGERRDATPGRPRHPHSRARPRHDRRHACSSRETSSTSCRMIRASCTTFTCSRRAGASPRRPTGGTKWSLGWSRGSRGTSIPKAKSSRCSAGLPPPGVDMLSIIRKYQSADRISARRAGGGGANPGRQSTPSRFAPAAKTCASNSSSRLIPTTRAISTMPSTSSDSPVAAGSLGVHIADVAAYVTPGSALDREALQARKQRLPAGPRHPDAAGALEQRRLQFEAGRRSADAFGLHPIQQRRTPQQTPFRANRDPERAPAHLPRSLTPFCKQRASTTSSATSAHRVGAGRATAPAAL